MIFGFDTIQSMGTCIKLFTTIFQKLFRSSGKVEQLRSYIQGLLIFSQSATKDAAVLESKMYHCNFFIWLYFFAKLQKTQTQTDRRYE